MLNHKVTRAMPLSFINK